MTAFILGFVTATIGEAVLFVYYYKTIGAKFFAIEQKIKDFFNSL